MQVLFSNIHVPYYMYISVQLALANHNWFFAYLLSASVVAGKPVAKSIIMHYDLIRNNLQ